MEDRKIGKSSHVPVNWHSLVAVGVTVMIKFAVEDGTIRIETEAIEAAVRTEGYTSGVAAGSLLDKKTGARDLGFGLSIVDFLLEPADPNRPNEKGQYEF